MTEPQKMGLKEVMGLAAKYAEDFEFGNHHYGSQQALESALTTIIEERDRAVKERDELRVERDTVNADSDMEYSMVKAAYDEAVIERDQAVRDLSECHRISGAESHEPAEAWRDAPNAVSAVTELRKDYDAALDSLADRDALAQRVTKLEKAVMIGFLRTDLDTGQIECIHCHLCSDDESAIAHAPDCIVRTINHQP